MPKLSQWQSLSRQSTDTSPVAMTPCSELATLTLNNRGLAYADGFFTTMAVVQGRIVWSDYHYKRLVSHAQALQLECNSTYVWSQLQQQARHLNHGVLKLIVTRAMQDIRGYGFTADVAGSACEGWLQSTPLPMTTTNYLHVSDEIYIAMQPTSHALCLQSQLACLPPVLAGLKTLNRLDSVLASGELQRLKSNQSMIELPDIQKYPLDIGEGLVRDMSGSWVEGTMSNVFYQLSQPTSLEQQFSKSDSLLDLNKNDSNYLTQGQWYTPSMAQSGVAGVMRQVIIDSLANTKNPVIIRSLQDEDLPQLSQLFFCNAVRGVMPMKSLTLLSGEVMAF